MNANQPRTDLLIITPGRGGSPLQSEIRALEDAEWALRDMSKAARPFTVRIMRRGTIGRPKPLPYCGACDCWELPGHERTPQRAPKVGDVLRNDRTWRRWTDREAGWEDRMFGADRDDPSWQREERAEVVVVTGLEHHDAIEPFAYDGRSYRGVSAWTEVLYSHELEGEWTDEGRAEVKEGVKDDNGKCELKEWREWMSEGWAAAP